LTVLAELRRLRFEPAGFFPKTIDARGRLIEVNGIFVRT
jgi:hypothetical protein